MSGKFDHGSLEKGSSADDHVVEEYGDVHVAPERVDEVRPDDVIVSRFRGPVGTFFNKLFAAGVEARGVERVPESERTSKGTVNSLLMWFSVNTVLTTVPIGCLAQAYYTLTLPHTIATIACFGALGCLLPAFVATLGPKTGLRTMMISRYSAGWAGGSIFAFLNILTEMGFSVTCVILGGQTLASINNALPLTVGIIIISICTLIVCFFGYDVLHVYERYAWIGITIVFCMLYGLGGKAGYNVGAQKPLEDTGRSLTGDVLSFGGIVFGSVAGWSPISADFNVRLPVGTSSTKIFFLTFFGIWIPAFFVETLGACLMTISYAPDIFENEGTGGLIAEVLAPWHGFGKFLLVVLALSVVANNIPNTYSTALSIQALGRPFQIVPRFVWTIIVAVAYTVAGIAGREHFASVLSNLLSILSYWVAFMAVIMAEEHFIFRRRTGYDLTIYDQPSKLPMGIAAIGAMCFGVAGAVVGMAQVYYTGPIGKLIATPYGGDLGFELAAAFAGVTFPLFRWLEIKYTGR